MYIYPENTSRYNTSMKKLFLFLLLSLGLASISYAADTIITTPKKMTDSQLRGWYSMISSNTKLQKNFEGNIKLTPNPTPPPAPTPDPTPPPVPTPDPAPPPVPAEEAPDLAPPPNAPGGGASLTPAPAPTPASDLAEEVVAEAPAEEAPDSAPAPVVASSTPVPEDTPGAAPDDSASEPAPAPNSPPMVELDVWIINNPVTQPISPSTDLETLTPDAPDAPDAQDVTPPPAPVTDDPCKPTKTVSADGTYFVYTCNGQASSSSVTNSVSVSAAEPALDQPFREGWKMVEGSNFWSVDEASPYWETEEGSKKQEAAKERGSWIEHEAARYARENPGVDAPNSGYWATDGCGEGKQPANASC